MNFLKYDGIIFDLDGTLLDSLYVWTKVDKIFLGRRGLEVPKNYFKVVSSMNFTQAAEYTKAEFGLSDNIEDIMSEWNSLACEEYAQKVKAKIGAKEFLAFVKSAGIKIALATASVESLYKPALKANGLYEYFDFFATTDDVERGKKFPDIYEFAAKNLGLKPENCLVIEDIVEALESAKTGGFDTAAMLGEHYIFNWDRMKEISDFSFNDYNTLLSDSEAYHRITVGLDNNPFARIIRRKVFIEEQGFINEFDDIDKNAVHCVLFYGDKPAATGRAFVDNGEWKIGRVCCAKKLRGRGAGSEIMNYLAEYITKQNGRSIHISSQLHAKSFYEKLGYKAYGEEYLDEHCPHVAMVKCL